MTAPPNRSGWRAALIGVSRYTHPKLVDIPAAVANVHDLAHLLTAPTGAALDNDHCTVLVDPDRTTQVGEVVARAVGEAEDVLLVYYAGHGLLDDRGRLHLALTDSDHSHLQWTSVPFTMLRDELAKSRARARILILDCCFSGRAFEAMSDPSTLVEGQIDIHGTYTIASSARDQPSQAPAGHRNTAFTGALLSAATRGTGLTLDQLYGKIDQILHRNGHPRPVRRSINITGNMCLFTPPGHPPAPPPDDAPIPPAIVPQATPDAATEQIFVHGLHAADQRNLAEAENAWHTAASQAHTGAMNNLANLLCTKGKLSEAHSWYLEAARRGNTDAMGNLADLLHRAHEDTEAELWWDRAAEAGDTDAMYNLALMLDKARRFDDALGWYRRAAEAGHRNAMHNLAIRLRYRGQLTEADTWWHHAGHKRPQRISEKLRGPAPHRQSR